VGTALTVIFALHAGGFVIIVITGSVVGLVVSMMELEKDARKLSPWRLGLDDFIDISNTQVASFILNSVTRYLIYTRIGELLIKYWELILLEIDNLDPSV